MDYSRYKDLKIRRLEPGILELVMGEEGGKLSTATAIALFLPRRKTGPMHLTQGNAADAPECEERIKGNCTCIRNNADTDGEEDY